MGIVSNIGGIIGRIINPREPDVNVITRPPSSPEPRPPTVVPDSNSPTGYSDRIGQPVSPAPVCPVCPVFPV